MARPSLRNVTTFAARLALIAPAGCGGADVMPARYADAGHMVTLYQASDLLADVRAFLAASGLR